MKTYIKRPFYEKLIQPYIGLDLIKVLLGQRRVGKSYVLRQTIDLIKKKQVSSKKILYIDKENYDFEKIKDSEDLMAFVKTYFKNQNDKKYLFIDEVQEIKDFHLALRSLNASGDFDIYITGSNADLLSSDLANSLGGRYISLKIDGLSYKEFLDFHKLSPGRKALNQYIRYGTLPYLIHLEEDEEIRYNYLKAVYSTILLKDLVKRYEIRNVDFLERLVKFLAENIGSPFSAKNISDYLKSEGIKISTSVVINYLKYLADVFFIFQVARAEVEGKKVFKTNEKYYFNDLGIRNALVAYKADDINKVLENLVYQELLRRFDDVKVGKLGSNKEIDFIAEKNGKPEYFQVSYLIPNEKVMKREFENLASIDDNFPKTVISMDELKSDGYKGIKHLDIEEFLLQC